MPHSFSGNLIDFRIGDAAADEVCSSIVDIDKLKRDTLETIYGKGNRRQLRFTIKRSIQAYTIL